MSVTDNDQSDYNSWQHAMLAYCSYKGDTTLWNEWRENHSKTSVLIKGANLNGFFLDNINLEGVRLTGAKLRGVSFGDADLRYVWLDGANLQGAWLGGAKMKKALMQYSNLQGAKFWHLSDLQGASLIGAKLQGAWFVLSNLGSTDFSYAQVDGTTIIEGSCYFDRGTNFTGVGLDSAIIYPDIKTAFRNNIRRFHWREWINRGNWFTGLFKKAFWWMNDYGSSSSRIIYTFFGLALLFGVLYFVLEFAGKGVIENLVVDGAPWHLMLVRALYFSVVTMTTLGFGDMYALSTSYLGCLLLMIQVVLGYVILGALVTRLGILFTSEAPAANKQPWYLRCGNERPRSPLR